MIAQDSHHTILGLDRTEQLTMGLNLLSPFILQVARKHHEVGMLRVDALHRIAKDGLPTARIGTHMGIAELHYLIALKSLWHRTMGVAELGCPDDIRPYEGAVEIHGS